MCQSALYKCMALVNNIKPGYEQPRHWNFQIWLKNVLLYFILFFNTTTSRVTEMHCQERREDPNFLHARPWIPGDEKALFTVVFHKWRSPLRQFARARTIDEYDVTMLVYPVCVTSQINCGDVTMPSQKKTVLDVNCDMSDRWLFSEILCVKDIKLRVRNKIIQSLPWITIFGSLVIRFTNDFHSWLRHSWKSLANRLTRDPKIVIHGNSCIIH